MENNTITSEWTDKDWNKFTTWLKGMLHVSDMSVTFTKADGTERVMKCTLQPELLPKVEIKENMVFYPIISTCFPFSCIPRKPAGQE